MLAFIRVVVSTYLLCGIYWLLISYYSSMGHLYGLFIHSHIPLLVYKAECEVNLCVGYSCTAFNNNMGSILGLVSVSFPSWYIRLNME